jgi:addiction module RelB/DinJ family antitoxin
VVLDMATKTANVTARIKPEIKESAEAILEKLGIPVSVFIDMTYRQVIANNGIPFSLSLPKTITTRDEMTDAQFDAMMKTGLAQAKTDESKTAEEVFADLRKRI